MTVQEAAVMRIDVDGESLTMTWTLQDLEAALEPLLERMRQPVERALRDSRIRPQELDAVVLAGGSTRLLAVRQLVTRLFGRDRKSTRLNSSHTVISYAVFCLKKKTKSRHADL